MAQQTAVEWLITQVNSEQYQIAFGQTYISIDLIEQAKQMEQEQLKEMYLRGIENYDPTFKRKSQWTEVDNTTRRLK